MSDDVVKIEGTPLLSTDTTALPTCAECAALNETCDWLAASIRDAVGEMNEMEEERNAALALLLEARAALEWILHATRCPECDYRETGYCAAHAEGAAVLAKLAAP